MIRPTIIYEYLHGDCVVEINRNGKRAAIAIAHGPCGCAEKECQDFDGVPMWERLRNGDEIAWREIERAYQAQKERYALFPITSLSTDEERAEHTRLYEASIAQNV